MRGSANHRGAAIRPAATLVACLLLAACAGSDVEYSYPRSGPGGLPTYEEKQSVFGPGGLTLFSTGPDQPAEGDGTGGIPINAFLWRASLDTVSFMPLSSADPFGGVILTDWYNPPDTPDERFKVNIFIFDRALRADGVRAAVFKQARADGVWRDVKPGTELGRQLEDAILTRARQLRIASTPAPN